MKIVVDTSVLVDHLRGLPASVALLDAAARAGHELWSVTVVRTEVLAGMRPAEAESTLALLDAMRWQDVTPSLADAAGRLAARYLRSHRGVDTVDYLVAATVGALDAALYTLNVKHFPMIPGLAPAYR